MRQLQRYFRQSHQTALGEWLNAVRLELAYNRLGAACTVKEVAFELGYKQLSHFSRDFKRFHGVSPGQLLGFKRV